MISRASSPIKPLTLRGNFAWTTFGNVVYSFCSWLMLTVIAKLGNPAMVGEFSLGLAVAQPILAFSQMNLNQVQATDARREYRFGDYLGLRLVTNALALMALVGTAAWDGQDREKAAVMLLVGLGLAFDAVGDVTFGLLRQHERMDRIAISMAAGGLLSLGMLTGGLVLLHSIVWAAGGSTLASVLMVLGYDVPNAVFLLRASPADMPRLLSVAGRFCVPKPEWDLRTLARLAGLALPLGVIMLLISLNNNIARYFVAHSLGVRELGIFSALVSFLAVGRLVTSALGLSASPRLARYYADGDRRSFTTLLRWLLLAGGALGIAAPVIAFFAGRQILTFFYTPEYARHLDVFVLYQAAGGVGYVAGFLGYGITAARHFKVQTVALAVSVVVTALTCAWLVPVYGLRGAAWSFLLASLTQLLGNLLILRHTLKVLPAPSTSSQGLPEPGPLGRERGMEHADSA